MQLLAGAGVEHPYLAVIAPGGDQFAVAGEPDRADLLPCPIRAEELTAFRSGKCTSSACRMPEWPIANPSTAATNIPLMSAIRLMGNPAE
jgi:hypothetical protein